MNSSSLGPKYDLLMSTDTSTEPIPVEGLVPKFAYPSPRLARIKPLFRLYVTFDHSDLLLVSCAAL